MYNIVEKFISINGEGKRCGQLANFIRFANCNLDCSYCDTKWANESDVQYDKMTKEAIYKYVVDSGVKNITLTGGEPLIQENIYELLEYLSKDSEIFIEIETNGSVDISRIQDLENPPSLTMDYKLPSSEMESHMLESNFKHLKKKDIIKFVAGTFEDLDKTKEIIEEHNLSNQTNVYISGVYGDIQANDIVDFMKTNMMNDVTLQLQLHKYIWDPNEKGV